MMMMMMMMTKYFLGAFVEVRKATIGFVCWLPKANR